MEPLKTVFPFNAKTPYSAPEMRVVVLSAGDILQTSLNYTDAASAGDVWEWDIVWR